MVCEEGVEIWYVYREGVEMRRGVEIWHVYRRTSYDSVQQTQSVTVDEWLPSYAL